MNKVNIEGTANIVNVALDNNIKKIAYVSSIATLARNSMRSRKFGEHPLRE